jgi:hypothetical protein
MTFEYLKRVCFFTLLIGTGLTIAGCYQVHSDDDLRTVPVTNNPHVIQDSGKTAQLPGMGY